MNELLDWLVRGTLHATLVAALVLLVRALLMRRLPPRLLSLLWMILLARMVLPWAPGSPFSIHNLIADAWDATSPTPAAADLPAGPLPETALPDTGTDRWRAADPRLRGARGASSTGPARVSLATLLPGVWLSGVVLLAVLAIGVNVVHWRRIRRQPPVTDVGALRLLRQCRRKMALLREPCLVETSYAHAPALFGLIRPRLLLPEGTLAALSPTELRHVFNHELAHLKRRDIALNWLTAGLQIAHWFNPVIWFAFRRWRADRETMCDALALAHIPADEFHRYAATLLALAERRFGPNFVPGLARLLERKAELKRRISMIHKYDTLRRQTPWLSISVVAVVALISLTNAQARRAGRPEAVEGAAGWRTADGMRPAHVPATSWLDENNRIVDKTDFPFVDDPAILGLWASVDLVENTADFDPAQPRWEGELYLQALAFGAGGGTRVKTAHDSELRPGPWAWTKGRLLHRGDHTAAAYAIATIDDAEYLFLEWKSGEYVIRHAKPAYYVFVRSADSGEADVPPVFDDGASRGSHRGHATVSPPPTTTWTRGDARPAYVPASSWLDENGRIVDKTDDPFVDDPAVLGLWASVDFVENMEDFDPAQPRWQGELYLQKLDFGAGGGTRVKTAHDSELRPGPWAWTKGVLMHGGDHTAAAYVLETTDDADYLFLEWKSGDYTARHMKPCYYVLRRVR